MVVYLIRKTRNWALAMNQPDEAALQDLIADHWESARRVALSIVREPSPAEDVVQEALLRIIRHRDRFDSSRPFRPWFLKIVANVARSQLRQRGRRSAREARIARPMGQEDLTRDERALIHESLANLDPDLRLAVSLKYIEGLTFKEAAEVLECPPGTAASRVRRGLEALREQLVPLGVVAGALPVLLATPAQAGPAVCAPSAAQILALADAGSAGRGPVRIQAVLTLLVALLLGGGVLAALSDSDPTRVSGPSQVVALASSGGGLQAPPPSGLGGAPDPNPNPAQQTHPAREAAGGGSTSAPGPRPSGRSSNTRVSGSLLGKPLESAWVLVAEQAYEPFFLHTEFGWPVPPEAQQVSAEGSFELDLLPGRYHLIAGALGRRTTSIPIVVETEVQRLDPIALVGESVARVELQVLGSGPLTVRLEGEIPLVQNGSTTSVHFTKTLTLPQDGPSGSTLRLRPGAYGLALVRPYRSLVAQVELQAGPNHPVFLERVALETLQVRVQDSKGLPVEGATIKVRHLAGKLKPLGLRQPHLAELIPASYLGPTTDSAGARSELVTPGKLEVFARRGRFAGRSSVIEVTGPAEALITLDQELDWGSVSLVPKTARPVRVLAVRVRGAQYEIERAFFYVDAKSPPSLELPPGDYEAEAEALVPEGLFVPIQLKIQVEPGSSASYTLSFKTGGAVLEGRLSGVAREELAGARVTLRLPGASAGREAIPDSAGRFRFQGLDPAQAYDLDLRAPGYAPTRFNGLKARANPYPLKCLADVPIVVRDKEGNPIEAFVSVRKEGQVLLKDVSTTETGRLLVEPGVGQFELEVYVPAFVFGEKGGVTVTRDPSFSAYAQSVYLNSGSPVEVILEELPEGD